MKKILAIVLAALMVLSLAGCGSSGLDADKLSEIMSAIESIQSTLDSMQAAAPAADASANAIKGYATYGDPVMMAGPEAQEFVGAGYDALVAFAAG